MSRVQLPFPAPKDEATRASGSPLCIIVRSRPRWAPKAAVRPIFPSRGTVRDSQQEHREARAFLRQAQRDRAERGMPRRNTKRCSGNIPRASASTASAPDTCPPSVLERKFGDSLRLDAMGRVLEKAVEEALKDADPKEQPLAYSTPSLEGEPDFALDKDFSFAVKYDVFPSIEVGDWKGIEIDEAQGRDRDRGRGARARGHPRAQRHRRRARRLRRRRQGRRRHRRLPRGRQPTARRSPAPSARTSPSRSAPATTSTRSTTRSSA